MNGHEDDTLLKFFKNGFVVHDGPHLDKAALEQSLLAKGAMFRVQGPFDETPQAIQQEDMIAQNLNSQEAFFIIKPDSNKASYAWFGIGCSVGERGYAERLEKILNCSSCTHVEETQEPDDFWATLGGKTEYSSTKLLNFAPGFEPRMFQVSVHSGLNHFDEIKNFRQTDLNNWDVMIVDAYMTIWIWIGNKSEEREKKNAIKRVDAYKKALTDGRDIKKVQVVCIAPCNEPFTFTGLFPEWEDEISATWVEEKKAGKVVTEEQKAEDSKYKDPTKNKFDLETLKATFPEGVNPLTKEAYLEDAVFEEVFKMTRRDFGELKQWKKDKLKKEVGLF